MKTTLYPLKFTPYFLDKIWGGQKIGSILNKDYGDLPNCGETWELSWVEGRVSRVSEGPLSGRPLDELIREYKTELVGTDVYKTYGNEFPLLIKFIDAAEDLSIQVHPDDELAAARHDGKGKTEMWYILDADPGATLIAGFNQPMSREKYLEYFQSGRLEEVLNREEVEPGDVFYIPAGRIHTIGKGILLAEIQQTSDITYRIYDFDRRDAEGNLRELHTEEALDALDFEFYEEYKTPYAERKNHRNPVVEEKYFRTNKLTLDQPMTFSQDGDKFKILICTEGGGRIQWQEGEVALVKGEVCLIPACLETITVVPSGEMQVIETMT